MKKSSLFLCLLAVLAPSFNAHANKRTPLSEYRILSMESVDLSGTEYAENRESLGQHLVIDLFGCNPEKIKEVASVEKVMIEAALAAKATIVAQKFHQFMPSGVSGALVLAESHLAIHTWPEVQGYCAIDIFTCGQTDNFAALEVLKAGFEAKGYVIVEIERGKQRSDLVSGEKGSVFFREKLDPLNGFKATVEVKDLLESVESEFQKIEVYETPAFGKLLLLDGIIQLTEYDNAGYHEMIVHVPLQSHKNPRKVLIIGGGDGGALSELVKYKNIEEIVICDIDPMVSKIAGKYFPQFAEAYNDPRVRSIHQDGAQFVQQFSNYFDVIIVDGTDFNGTAQSFAHQQFNQHIFDALTAEGIMTMQAESLFYDRHFIKDLYTQAQQQFPITSYYNVLVPSYPSGSIGFLFCSKKYAHTEMRNTDKTPLKNLEFYNPQIHQASFALPTFLKKLLEERVAAK